MPSILHGYEYDIFISYRHNDNLDGWVTNFVESLEKELRGTLKESLTIYFDKNPHDGLRETHHVDKSLEGKLKCLIFIPIISQTYCDPKSFAWQHEFVAFNKLAQADQLGRDIKLSKGNLASRILPIKIHELDAEDTNTIETEIGGMLRAIEFIYKEPGVNRPLKVTDERNNNQNQTDYSNQVNKLANAIKELIYAIKPSKKSLTDKLEDTIVHPTKSTRKLGTIVASLVFVLALVAYFFYPRLTSIPETEEIDKSIAVLPFVNMSADPEQEYFSDGLSEELLNLLSKIPELKVIARTSSFSFKGRDTDVREIGQLLGVTYILEGSVRKSGNQLRITAQLIKTDDGSHIWSDTYDRQLTQVFAIQDEISAKVVNQLKLSIPGLIQKTIVPKSIKVYELLLESKYIDRMGGSRDKRIALLEHALAIDSTDSHVWAQLADAYAVWYVNPNQRPINAAKAKNAAKMALQLDPNNGSAHEALAGIYLLYDWDWKNAEKELTIAEELGAEYGGALDILYTIFDRTKESISAGKRKIKIDTLNPWSWWSLGDTYLHSDSIEKSIPFFQQSIKLNPKYDLAIGSLGLAYTDLGKYDLALKTYEQFQNPESSRPLYLFSKTYFEIGDLAQSDRYLEALIAGDRYVDNSALIAQLYAQRGEADKCFEWIQEAYDRKNPSMCFLKKSWDSVKKLNDPRFNEFLKKMNLPID